jgi:lysyl-tRNA synthetase class II
MADGSLPVAARKAVVSPVRQVRVNSACAACASAAMRAVSARGSLAKRTCAARLEAPAAEVSPAMATHMPATVTPMARTSRSAERRLAS